MEAWTVTTLLVLGLLGGSHGYHDIGNSGIMADWDFHCWPPGSQLAYDDCDGLDMDWIVPPPATVKNSDPINMTYSLTLGNSFWSWAVDHGLFEFNNLTTAAEAEDWCLNTPCSGDPDNINKWSCCIFHVNVHSCPLATQSFCGPWVPSDGALFTHSEVLYGPVSTTNWSSTVGGLFVDGETELIAHFKIGDLQTTLMARLTVTPRAVCGDDFCDEVEGETCSNCPADCGTCPLEVWVIVIIALVACVFVFTIGGMLLYFQIKQRKLLYDESWIITSEEIKPDNVKRGFMGSAISLAAEGSGGMETENKLNANAANKQVFCKTSIVNGQTVAIRKIPRKSFSLTKAVRKEVKDIRTMEHANLAKFVGACLEVPDMAVLMEYCPKGSLSDVLLNEDVPLNWGFRFSFGLDIVRGIRQLHSHGCVHGHLTSNNCIIDDRWTVKVTDYGLPLLRMEERDEEQEEEEQWKLKRTAIYRGPETLELEYTKPTPASDTYAFAMILVEIAIRNEPQGDDDDYCDDIVAGYKPSLPAHDEANADDTCPAPESYNKLISECWDDNPANRPDFETIKKTLTKINPNKQSPIDLMMAMMEKYSKHLEAIVGERTADLMVEKQKTDRLLYSMLPRAVADDLRQGKTIDAVQYSSCTIFFSDIVGFTALSGSSTPFEVVALLNKLYICFDTIIDKYDVYKVETIGDAYMVVSGVPNVNGNLHAREISNMSLELVSECLTFVIPHKPGESLKIRVGNHTGPVCAGVVGLKMPRYCLFGDTVNTASRMESNGEAYKIHQSNYTYEMLQEIGSFKHEFRGTIPVKGKGEMKTWWLTGKDNPPADLDRLNGEIDRVLLSAKDRKISAADSGFNDKHGEDLPELPALATDQKLELPNVPENVKSTKKPNPKKK